MTTTTVFETLAVNAADHNSRKIAHRATRPSKLSGGAPEENLNMARTAIALLEASRESRNAAYDWQVSRRKTLQAQLAGLELDGEGHEGQIGEVMTEMDSLEESIKRWSIVEPEMSARIVTAKKDLADYERRSKIAQVELLLDAEKGLALNVLHAYETLVEQSGRLHSALAAKRRLQADLGGSCEGMSNIPSLSISERAFAEARQNVLLDAAKAALLSN